MNDEQVPGGATTPLNLQVHRSPVKSRRLPYRRAAELLALVGPATLMLIALGKRLRYRYPTAVALAGSSLGALAAARMARRRRSEREAAIDEGIKQSFPASDPPAH